MKKIEFELKNPVTLTPLRGQSDVTIRTTGDVLVVDREPTVHEPRKVVLVEMKNAELSVSPKGLFQTLRMRYEISQASRRAYHQLVDNVFDMVEGGER